jgi:hypothetical protein
MAPPGWTVTEVLASGDGAAWFWPLPPAVAASAGTATAGGLALGEGAAWFWPLPPAVAAWPSVVPPPFETSAAIAPLAEKSSIAAVADRQIMRIVVLLETDTPARPRRSSEQERGAAI